MKKTDAQQFRNYILRWYALHGRTELPWRQTTNPYHILVSELMLQQTQVERVIPKFKAFLTAFPSIESLAAASLAEVLTLWQGLGYNRRAKFLHQTATEVQKSHGGIFPTTAEELQKLPGIGPYTARAVSTFAFNNPEVVIETNIRAVYIYHFFPGRFDVADRELEPTITATIHTANPREWFAALMDYGSYLKKVLPNPSRKSKHHVVQSKFEGSPRQVRGEIIRYLSLTDRLTEVELLEKIVGNKRHFKHALEDLLAEKMIETQNDVFFLSRR